MVPFILLIMLQFSMAAIPAIREQDPIVSAIDEMEELLSEYQEPDLIDYQLSSIQGIPIVSLLEMAKKHLDTRKKSLSRKERIGDVKKNLHDIVYKLQVAIGKLEKGNFSVYTEIQKAIQDLKSVEGDLRQDVKITKSLQTDETNIGSDDLLSYPPSSPGDAARRTSYPVAGALLNEKWEESSPNLATKEEILAQPIFSEQPETVIDSPLLSYIEPVNVQAEILMALAESTQEPGSGAPIKKEKVEDVQNYRKKMSLMSSGIL